MLKRTVDPAELPVTLDEVKAHLRVTSSTEDADIMGYLLSVVSSLDGDQGLLNGRALVTQTWEMKLYGFPLDGVEIPIAPVQSVISITYVDSDGAEQTLATPVYT